MAAAEPTPLPLTASGGKIGRYELTAEIASGGMGRVYLARARGPAGFEKLVALKCIHPELSTEQSFIDMFFDEARIAARIDHPNVCRVFDFGEADGRYFIAMEYMVGEPVTKIARKLASQPESTESDEIVAHIVAEAAEGLHAAHELQDENGKPLDVVHRDVSPQNLFVTYDGSVRVVDFGIASAQGRLHRTSTGSVKGKLAYMAPEQMRREPADRRVDVWALGVVLWELLARKRLFRGANELEVMLAVLNDAVPLPSTVRPSIDPLLEKIVMKALAKDLGERYATARELSSALNHWVVGRGVVVGMAEIAAFMSGAFVAERAARFELVDRARRETSSSVDIAPPGEGEIPIHTVTRETVSSGASRRARAARLRAPLAASAVVLVLGGAFGAWRVMSPPAEPNREPREVALPQTPTPPPVTPEPAVVVAPPSPPVAPVEVEPAHPTPPEVHRRPRPPAATTGRLHVETPGGWADVYVDGRRLGRTPLDAELPVGRVSIELRPFGLAPMSGDPALRRSATIGERVANLTVPVGS